MAISKKVKKTKGRAGKKPAKSVSYHHGALKATLIEAALKLLKTQSPETLSLRELARSAGVSQAAPYRHFKDKKELIAAIIEQGFDLKFKYMAKAIKDSDGDAKKMYFDTGLAYFKMGLNHPQHFKLLTSSEVVPSPEYPSLLIVASKTYLLLKEMIVYCQKKGVIGAGDPYHKALNCWCLVNGFTALYAEGRLRLIGVDEDNAEAALKTFFSQNLIGNDKSLAKSDYGFKPFKTSDSTFLKEAFLDPGSPEIDAVFAVFK